MTKRLQSLSNGQKIHMPDSEDFERILAALRVRGAALHLVAPQILRREEERGRCEVNLGGCVNASVLINIAGRHLYPRFTPRAFSTFAMRQVSSKASL